MAVESDINANVCPVQVRLTRGPIRSPHAFPPVGVEHCGAVIQFRGVVRASESNAPIEGLEYQIYEPMTSRELQQLGERQRSRHGVTAVDVEHSFGFVAGGECSFVLQVASSHRTEAIRFVDEFIIEMKQHVPIWKVPVT